MITEFQKQSIQYIKLIINEKEKISSGFFDDHNLYKIEKTLALHSLEHLLYPLELKKDRIDDKILKKINQSYLKAIRRRARQDEIVDRLYKELDKKKIKYIFLKGYELCELYPERWMRISNDIDVLVRKDDYENAKRITTSISGIKEISTSSHHIEYASEKNMVIELHREALSISSSDETEITNLVWESAMPISDLTYRMRMSDDWFYVHHLLHMISHLKKGGCGIKFFLDLYLLNKKNISEEDKKNRDILVQRYNIQKFEKAAVDLSNSWFGNEVHPELADFEQLIIESGTFGKYNTKVLMDYRDDNTYLFRRLFPKYEKLILDYPKLKRNRWMTPIYEIVRGVTLIKNGYSKNLKVELKTLNNLSNEEIEKSNKIKEQLGL